MFVVFSIYPEGVFSYCALYTILFSSARKEIIKHFKGPLLSAANIPYPNALLMEMFQTLLTQKLADYGPL